MSNNELPPNQANVSEVNSQLRDGIQTCRSVIANYRNLLAGHRDSSNDNDVGMGESLSGADEK